MNKRCHSISRLAIMKAGKIICEGNPTELKAKEGEGYKLNIKMKHLDQKHDLDDFLKSNFRNLRKESEKDKWVTYNLTGNISEMLGVLATAKLQFELEGFTINMISLEDVFLQVTKGLTQKVIPFLYLFIHFIFRCEPEYGF